MLQALHESLPSTLHQVNIMLTSIYGFYYPSAEQYDETRGQTAVDIRYEVKIEEIENVVVRLS